MTDLLIAAGPLGTATSRLHPDLPGRLDAVVDGAIAAQRVVGAVVVASVDGKLVYGRAAGLADRERGDAVRKDTLFRLASVSKLWVSAAAMALAGQGRLGIDDDIRTWLPDFQPRLADDTEPAITIRHLLTHTSGIGYGFLEPEDGPYHRAGVSDGMDQTTLTLGENLARLASVPLLFAPGTAWHYSLSIDVVGAIVEKVAGAPLPEVVRDLVSKPLDVIDTDFRLRDAARLAAAYADGSPRPRRMADADRLPTFEGLAPVAMYPARAFDENAFPSGGAGMIGTASDTLQLLEALRRGGAPVLAERFAAEMGRNQIGDLPVEGWPGWGYGLGFSILKNPAASGAPESPGTWRWGGAYGHSWFVDPAEKLTVVAFTNTAFEGMSGGGRFPQDICRAIYQL